MHDMLGPLAARKMSSVKNIPFELQMKVKLDAINNPWPYPNKLPLTGNK
jgi:hypothetical protein